MPRPDASARTDAAARAASDAGRSPDTDAGALDPPPAPALDSFGPSVERLGAPPGTAFSFAVQDGTLGFQLAGANLWIDTLTDPRGRAYYADGLPVGWPSALYGPGSPQAFMNDATVALGIVPGEWTATLLASTGGAPISLVAQRDHDGMFHGGVLDLYLYVARGGVTDPDRGVTIAPGNVVAEYAEGIDRFFDKLSRLVGIDRGEVTVIAVDDRYAAIDGDAEEDAAFGASQAGLGPGYHAMLVRGGYERGWAGITPAAPAEQLAGAPRSTVLMDVRGRDYFDFTLLHELGHVTGLYHPSDVYVEAGVSHFLHDPLGDTSECTRTTALMGETFPACFEESNLMASYAMTRPPTLSPTQLAIFRSSAVYRPYTADRPVVRSLRIGGPGLRPPPPDVAARWTHCTPPG